MNKAAIRLIENVADTLAKTDGQIWDDLTGLARDGYRVRAKAAIAVVLEEAAKKAVSMYRVRHPVGEDIAAAIRALIDTNNNRDIECSASLCEQSGRVK